MVFFRSIKKVNLLVSLVLIAIGYFFITMEEKGIELCVYIAAGGLGAAGLFSMIRYFMLKVDERYKRNDFAMGVIIIAMGVFFYLLKDRLTDSLHLIIGVVMIMCGLFCIQDAIDGKQIGMRSIAIYFFLLLLDDYYTVGVCFFIAVQLTYLYYLYLHRCRPILLPRGLGLILGMILLVISGQVSALNVAVLIYFSSLLFNALSSFTKTELKIMSLGFVLFICCDICVGLNYILPAGNFYQIVTFGMWFFYLPSQVLICLGSEKLLPE